MPYHVPCAYGRATCQAFGIERIRVQSIFLRGFQHIVIFDMFDIHYIVKITLVCAKHINHAVPFMAGAEGKIHWVVQLDSYNL